MSFFILGKFLFVLFIVQTLAGLFNYYFFEVREFSSLEFEVLKQYVIYIFFSTPVYMYFAYKIEEKHYLYAFLSAVIVLLLGVIITSLIISEAPNIVLLVFDISTTLFACTLGTYTGLKLRER